MIGLMIAIIIFNVIAFKTNKILNPSQVLHIWMFTIAFQQTFDVFVELKYHGYWYFGQRVDWKGLVPHLFVIPPVNMIFLNWYPFKGKKIKQLIYLVIFVIAILIYEAITLLPEPWGYFNSGWWTLKVSAFVDPILLLILLGYYRFVRRLENANKAN